MKQPFITYQYSRQLISVNRLEREHGGFDKYLKEAGDDGWQLVGLVPRYLVDDSNHTISSYEFVFMRPKI
jgi:predicted N-acyltransferase